MTGLLVRDSASRKCSKQAKKPKPDGIFSSWAFSLPRFAAGLFFALFQRLDPDGGVKAVVRTFMPGYCAFWLFSKFSKAGIEPPENDIAERQKGRHPDEGE